jgi:SWI/SNF-related matrix-associated actin-dependent regulator of chromatin subfamily A3
MPEPCNRTDIKTNSNAIRVDNVSATQIGHVPRQSAAKLAKYIDNGWYVVRLIRFIHSLFLTSSFRLNLVATLAGRIGTYDCPLTIQMFGPDPTTEAGQQLMERMSADKLPVKAVKAAERERLKTARRQAASGSSKYKSRPEADGDAATPMMDDILESSERFDVRKAARDTEAYGVKETDLEAMPMAIKPEAIRTEMLPYQLQALQWLIDHENPDISAPGPENSVQLWSRESGGKKLYTNLATNHSTQACPKLASGGVLADDMGLGKTLEMIALMVANTKQAGRGPTLVVAPLSVMSNWSGQISHHIHKGHALKVYTYHGAGRVDMSASEFGEYDVVITTYQTLAIDYLPRGKGKGKPQSGLRKNGLYSLEWRRIILDEGHIIRNPQSKGAAAVTAVMAKSRWVLTGTPIVNSLKDLYSLLRFVGITGGLETLEVFNSVLVRPLKAGDESGVFLLKAIMKAFTLRRRKDMKFIDLRLPALHEFVQRIDFALNERKRYDALAAEAKGMLQAYEKRKEAANTKAGSTYHHLLEILLRMRQCCNHWQLCSERVTDLLAQLESQETVDLSPENVKALQDVLQVQIESQEDCAICLETLHDPVITNCGHFFGRSCIGQVIERQHKCPMCRAELKDELCLVSPEHDCGDESVETNQDETEGSSTKLDAIVKILAASKSSGTKTIIFSQWTSFLNLIEAKLQSEDYKFCRLDGTMSAIERDRALGALEDDPATTVMLASLGVCAVGLNLTAANQIILSDTWW